MLVVQQGNKQLKVPDEAKEVYLSMGYSVLDEEGRILEAGQATSLAEIKAENSTLKNKLAECFYKILAYPVIKTDLLS